MYEEIDSPALYWPGEIDPDAVRVVGGSEKAQRELRDYMRRMRDRKRAIEGLPPIVDPPDPPPPKYGWRFWRRWRIY